ncbi:Acetyl-CoA carboxylase 1 [Hibiscus syriacus]|uniref:biotin carboxylase n=1 Tax=Hibiscus syriacus TaxID=106335 RepID=A0A6A2ZH03_HIBSY|nr:Acetyl-CoA carboxylase 1 [Hibiscus syriacus]
MAGVGRGNNGLVNGVLPIRSSATISEVDEFCFALGGKKPIHSILIANNGMAAVKFIRSIRTLAYEAFGTEKAILLVAMATPEDMRINAEHIRIADQFVEVPGGTNNNNYANVQLIVEMAEITHVDAVWPGWGHASENPELPDALNAKGIVFLGPPSVSMAALGDKIGSSLIAQAAYVPTLPWSGSHVKIAAESSLVSIPYEIYCKACVYTTEEAIASCQVVGYPAMIKASWGGGGKGIRKVHNDDEVRALFKQVQGEVPGSPIFIMKVASQSRHLEVQLLCDQYGNVAALHSRDCSVQRRHQKIIEEGPITVAPLETVKILEQAARRLAKSVNYVGAATVEYLYNMETGEYYFLELNPRLQVEHPVTEWIAEVNLPAAQVVVGMGIPLWQIPEIRRFYGMEHGGGYDSWRKTSVVATSFDFDKAESTRPKGHCVAVRVTSEDPDDGFKPTSGKVQELSFKSKPNVWAYFSVKSGGGIHEFSDSQFGHVFAFGESRALAIANMVLGLKEIQIRGEIRTNVDYTIDLLHASDYRENKIHTGWLDSRIAMRVRAERPPWYLSVVGGALYVSSHILELFFLLLEYVCYNFFIFSQKASASSAAMVSDYIGYLEKGQIPPKHISLVHSQVSLNIEGSKYTIDMVRGGQGSYRLRMNESEIEAEIHTLRDGGLLMQARISPLKVFNHWFACFIFACIVVQNLLNCLDSPELPFLQWQECMSVLATRLPKNLKNELESKCKGFEAISSSMNIDFPAKLLKGVLEFHLSSSPEKERSSLERLIEPLMSLVKSYEGGRESHARVIVRSLFEEYLSVEELFSDNIQADVIERLRLQYKKDLLRVVEIVLSHQGVKSKNKLILRLMEQLVYPNPAAYRDQLIRFSALNHTSYSELALKASQLMEQTKLSELRSSIARSLSELEMFTEDGETMDTPKRKSAINERMEDLVGAPLAVEDALVGLFDHSDHTLQRRVVETYVRRLYQPYLVKGSVRMQWHRSGLIASWDFLEEHIERKNVSEEQMSDKPLVEEHRERKWGAMVIIKSLQFLPAIISATLRETTPNIREATSNGSQEPTTFGNMMHIALVGINNQMSLLQDSGDEDQAQERVNKLAKILKDKEVGSSLRHAGVGVVSCIIQRDEGRTPMRHSFHWSTEKLYYEEEPLLRHLEPPLSIYLELDKLKGYQNIQYTPSRDRQWHLYTVVDKPQPIQRMFLRTLVRQTTSDDGLMAYQGLDAYMMRSQSAMPFTSRSILRCLMAAMEELELNMHNATLKSDHAHMYLCILREQQINDLVPYPEIVDLDAGREEAAVESILEELAQEIHAFVGVRLHKLGVCEWEVKLWMASSGQANGAWRVVVTNVTGQTCTLHVYRELEDTSKHRVVYHSLSVRGPMHGVLVNAHYQPLSVLDRKRLLARKNNTTYCYDFPLAFVTALQQSWASQFPGIKKPKDKLLPKVMELVFSDQKGNWGTPLVPVERQPGLNDVGMVAWCMEMFTPEFPSGRTILVVTNDVTFKAGSFGPREDAFFLAVTDLACSKKLPLIYLAANSGARIGVDEEVKACFKIGWSDESIPERGFQYIYLTPEDYTRIGSSVIAHEMKLASGESRWVIDTIVGKEDGLGVENLSGSGAIAGAYSRAYKETFTLTYVTGRTVGIGAYLSRLGMRCIQRLDQPIILTGFSALNKLLGREVYSSHMQLGGPKIMATNGVVHLTVSDDLEGVSAILNWLSCIPPHIGGPLPILKPLDPPERPVEYFPENSCDPRAAISGALDSSGNWKGGIFDRDSFVETLEGWARTVVTGRAKLGGIPVGIVAVETQTVMQVIPADPGQLDSHERVVPQAGQVWFPDSATKMAQAIMDFNREELPLFILANWRGFSGGQRDLFEGILQAGSTIVENLRTYNQPVFVYIPMMGELRGGAWVVVDSQINSDHIEMYAERTAKGNVLEPEGMIEIKFRTKELLECMGRLDQQLNRMKGTLQEAKRNGAHAQVDSLQLQMRSREKQLLPVYTQIATKFAELHDTSLRMAAKGVIKEVVDWDHSRSFFYRRLRRRIAESSLVKIIKDAAGDQLSHKSAMDLIKKWFSDSEIAKESEDAWLNDEAFFSWKDDQRNYSEKLKELRVQKVLLQLTNIGNSSSGMQALPQGLAALLSKMEPSSRKQVVDEIRKLQEALREVEVEDASAELSEFVVLAAEMVKLCSYY